MALVVTIGEANTCTCLSDHVIASPSLYSFVGRFSFAFSRAADRGQSTGCSGLICAPYLKGRFQGSLQPRGAYIWGGQTTGGRILGGVFLCVQGVCPPVSGSGMGCEGKEVHEMWMGDSSLSGPCRKSKRNGCLFVIYFLLVFETLVGGF